MKEAAKPKTSQKYLSQEIIIDMRFTKYQKYNGLHTEKRHCLISQSCTPKQSVCVGSHVHMNERANFHFPLTKQSFCSFCLSLPVISRGLQICGIHGCKVASVWSHRFIFKLSEPQKGLNRLGQMTVDQQRLCGTHGYD